MKSKGWRRQFWGDWFSPRSVEGPISELDLLVFGMEMKQKGPPHSVQKAPGEASERVSS